MNKMKHQFSGLRLTMLKMTLIPLFLLALVITIYSSRNVSNAMYNEVESGLEDLAKVTLYMYDLSYPGDFSIEGDKVILLKKGDEIISGNYDMIDQIKEDTGTEITIFYQDARVLTTITDDSGVRQIETGAHAKIVEDVLQGKEAHFYHNVLIGSKSYFAYYMPIVNSDGTVFGMIGIAKDSENVRMEILKVVFPIGIIAVLAMLCMTFISIRFTENLVQVIQKIKNFLGHIAKGNLQAEISPGVLIRKDELGEMGRFTVNVQKSLRELIEYDVLTGLFNRRSGDQKLRKVMKESLDYGKKFCVCLGDIDHFKSFNDTHGHECGDEVLKNVSEVLKNGVGKKGFVARWGGEEFLVVLERTEGIEGKDDIELLLEEIRNMETVYQDNVLHVTMTFGVSCGSGDISLHEILKSADEKLYYGKQNGRNRVIYEMEDKKGEF